MSTKMTILQKAALFALACTAPITALACYLLGVR
jgi:hypothetical protein